MCDCNLIRRVIQINPGTPDFLTIAKDIAEKNDCELVTTGDRFTEFYRDNDRSMEIQRRLQNFASE